MMTLSRFRSAVAAPLLAVALPAAGQETPLPDLFSDVIDVRVVNVEVVVTDRKGNRIRGLQASDFELLVDGEPTPIDYFTEIDDGRALAASTERIGNVPSVAPNDPVGTNYLIFIDELSAIKRHRDRVLDRLQADLVQLGPTDRVALVVFDGFNVSRLTDWTSSREAIEEALRQAREREALGLKRRVALSNRSTQLRRAVMAATAAVRSFAAAPGRKVMLLLAEAWRAPEDLPENAYRTRGIPALSVDDLYGPLVHSANLVGYTIYPVDLPGFHLVYMGPTGDASVEGAGLRGYDLYDGFLVLRRSPGDRYGFDYPDGSFGLPSDPEWGEHAVLEFLAHETGGLPMINARRDVALSTAVADTRSFYWLGFSPTRDENDTLHRLDVRLVGRSDLRARSRKHYLDMAKGTEVTMLVEGALLFGGSRGTDSLEVRFGSPRRSRFRKVLVPMEVVIPLDDITLLPMGGLWMNELELRVTVINEYGDRSETPVETIRIEGADKPKAGQYYIYDTGMKLRSRAHRFVAAVHDPVSGAILSTSGIVGPKKQTSLRH